MSMRNRILLAELGLVLLLGLAMIVLVRTALSSRLHSEVQKRAVALTEALAREAVDPALTERRLALQLLVNQYRESEQDVVYIFLLDSRGELLAHTFEAGFPSALRDANSVPEGERYSVQHLETEHGVILDIGVPMLGGGAGVVRLGVSEEAVRRDVNRLVRVAFALILGVLALGAVIAAVLTTFAMRPVRDLTAAVQAVGLGNLEQQVPVTHADELGRLGEAFNSMVAQRRRADVELRRAAETRALTNALLRLALEEMPLEDLLDRALDLILSAPLLDFEHRGCIFLVEGEPPVLVRKAATGFSEAVKSDCHRRPLGQCDCGRAAARRQVEFTVCHDVVCEGVGPSHYCVPIVFAGEALGVLNLYTGRGHRRDSAEQELLTAIANALAGIIQRRRAEEDRERMRTQFLRVQKTDAVGLLAGSVAHDLVNLLGVIDGHADRALANPADKQSTERALGQIRVAATGATAVVRQLLSFSRNQPMTFRPLDLNEVVQSLLDLLGHMVGEEIAIESALSPDLPKIVADRACIEQVLINLAVNARDAMPGGGTLRLETADVTIAEEQAKGVPGAWPDRFVRLTVADDGTGMTEHLQRQIFDPFFSTKSEDHRTGLGLPVVQGIVEQHEGWLAVESQPGLGSAFKIYFVAFASSTGAEVRRNVRNPAVPASGRRILLVEDEMLLRDFAKRVLTDRGYAVTETADAEAALELCHGPGHGFDLLFCDVVLPGLNGLDLAQRLVAETPTLAVLLTSASSGDKARLTHLREQGFAYIHKPYRTNALLSAVEEALSAKQDQAV